MLINLALHNETTLHAIAIGRLGGGFVMDWLDAAQCLPCLRGGILIHPLTMAGEKFLAFQAFIIDSDRQVNMMKKILGFFLLACATLLATTALAADDEKQMTIKKGAAHYRIFCINCHGEAADGNGPLANLLQIKPADLTRLRQTDGETSITDRVLKAVDGRHEVAAGEERKMPLFSDNLAITTVIEIAVFLEAFQQ